LRNVLAMPRSHGGLASPSYAKLLQNTLPAVKTGLAKLGYKQNLHYFIGKRPPKSLKWPEPYVLPDDFKHSMYWFNGTIISFLSFEREMSANSKSFDWIMGFEAKFLPSKQLQEELIPAIRGKREIFGHCPWHHGVTFTTDMPTLKSGFWLFDKQKDCDEELISYILHLVADKQQHHHDYMNGKLKDRYYSKYMAALETELAELRRQATLYREYDSLENIEVLGASFIRNQARDLPKTRFLTSILNKKPRKIEEGFYSALNEALHYYISENSKYLEGFGYDDHLTPTCLKDGDLKQDIPLCIALDYNTNINNISVGQKQGKYMMTVNHMYVKTPHKLKQLVTNFCDYYEPFLNRNVVYFYDNTAIPKSAASDETFADIVVEVLESRGWNVTKVFTGPAPEHDIKHEQIDMALQGDPKYLYPRFNKFNCETLLTSMERTGTIKIGEKTKKDKRDEAKADTPELPNEYKPHANDAWDTLFIGMNFHYRVDSKDYDLRSSY